MKALFLAFLCLFASPFIFAQQFEFPGAAVEDDAALSKAMPVLAGQVLTVYKDGDQDRYLNNLFRLQMIVGQYAQADATIRTLRDLRRAPNSAQANAKLAPFAIYAKAMIREAAAQLPFDEAFKQSFHEVYDRMDDRSASKELLWFGANLDRARDALRKALDQQKGKNDIALADALNLVQKYQHDQVYRSALPLMNALVAEDDTRRYIIDDDVLVKTPDGASIAIMVARPRSLAGPLPTLLEFTIYSKPSPTLADARMTAAHGYVGVVAFTRGKGRSPDMPVPYEHDGDDACAVIDWISKQTWSDGRVGMYAGSYNGFAQWAAAKHVPRALKAMMPAVAAVPGIDVPMEGNIFENFVYPWPLYTTITKTLDDATYFDSERWSRLNRTWYSTGKAYRALDQIDGTPNPFFRRWLDHPSYDAYWQNMVPYGKEFAAINIPILATGGDLQGQSLSSLYMFTEHRKYNPRAEHYVLIGPYDHFGAQQQPQDVIGGYQIDPAARIDIEDLRYQWFDYVFKGGKKPELLKDNVNYEVMGANEWKHAPSLEAMSDRSLRFHLTATRSGDAYRLSEQKPSADTSIDQKIDFADRSDADWPASGLTLSKTLDTHNGIAFVSDAIQQPTEISGQFSGQLDFITNKKDMDFNLELYELTPGGDYFDLSYYVARASYANDRTHRQLLTPGKRQRLDFKTGHMTSRKLQTGSRLVIVLSINKQPNLQINYGTGKDVSDETIVDAKEPMQIKWFSDSYVDLPVWR